MGKGTSAPEPIGHIRHVRHPMQKHNFEPNEKPNLKYLARETLSRARYLKFVSSSTRFSLTDALTENFRLSMSYFPSRRRKKHTLPRTVNPQSALPRCNTPVIYTENGRCAPQARTQISACQKQRAAIAEPTIGSNANEKSSPYAHSCCFFSAHACTSRWISAFIASNSIGVSAFLS